MAAAGFLLASLSLAPPGHAGDGKCNVAATGAGGVRIDGDRRIVAAELLVADPTPGFEQAVARLGFVVLERRSLPGLGLTVARLGLPGGLTEPAGRLLLRARFPAILADYDDLFRPSGAPSVPGREAAFGRCPHQACARPPERVALSAQNPPPAAR
jgi:hypothetical protein